MSSVIVVQSQSLLDLAIQEYGTIEAVIHLAFVNEISVTDELQPGAVLHTPEYNLKNDDVANYFAKKAILPATIISDEVELILDNEDPCNLCKCFL